MLGKLTFKPKAVLSGGEQTDNERCRRTAGRPPFSMLTVGPSRPPSSRMPRQKPGPLPTWHEHWLFDPEAILDQFHCSPSLLLGHGRTDISRVFGIPILVTPLG
jgi:hypothetical protein